MPTTPLSPYLTQVVLSYLNVQADTPDVALLDTLLEAYTRTVPWETASRIAKRARTLDTVSCPRWPDEFWDEAMKYGSGGTCFESNYAFFSLLLALGYEGYLTINDMEHSHGDHSAMVLDIHGERWLADVGIPIYTALPIKDNHRTHRVNRFHNYKVYPQHDDRHLVKRDRHPTATCLILIDRPVSDEVYRERVVADYTPEAGLFLDRLIVHKVIKGRQWYYNSRNKPPRIEEFVDGTRIDHLLTRETDLAGRIAGHFGMDEKMIAAALGVLGGGEK